MKYVSNCLFYLLLNMIIKFYLNSELSFVFIFQKLNKRMKALTNKSSYDENKKRRVRDVLRMDFMSSESEVESDSEEIFTVKKLDWRSREATKVFLELDKKASESLSSRSKRQMVKRVKSDFSSKRPVPDNISEDMRGCRIELIFLLINNNINNNKYFILELFFFFCIPFSCLMVNV